MMFSKKPVESQALKVREQYSRCLKDSSKSVKELQRLIQKGIHASRLEEDHANYEFFCREFQAAKSLSEEAVRPENTASKLSPAEDRVYTAIRDEFVRITEDFGFDFALGAAKSFVDVKTAKKLSIPSRDRVATALAYFRSLDD